MGTYSTSGDRLLLGRCECGAVRYRVADAFLYAAYCHCSRCRAATGSALRHLRVLSAANFRSRKAERTSSSTGRTS